MARYVTLPNGKSFEMREGETPAQAYQAAFSQYPEAFGFGAPPEPEKPKKDTSGFKAAASAATSRLQGGLGLLAGKIGLMGRDEAEAYNQQKEVEAAARHTPTQDNWIESPWLKLKEAAGSSLPTTAGVMAAGMGAAAAAPVLGVGTATAATAGSLAASLPAFTASNLQRQVGEGKSLDEASLPAAAAAAIPQALLDVLSLRVMPGIGRIFGAAGVPVTEATAKAMVSQTVRQKAAEYAAATGKVMGKEGAIEAIQALLERLQAGLSLTDADARREYFENAMGGAALAGAAGPVGHYVSRSQDIKASRQMAPPAPVATPPDEPPAEPAAGPQAPPTPPAAPSGGSGTALALPGPAPAAANDASVSPEAAQPAPAPAPAPAAQPAPAAPTVEEIKQQIAALREQRREAVAATTTPQETVEVNERFKQQALVLHEQLAAAGGPADTVQAQQLVKMGRQWQEAKAAGDDEKAARLAARITAFEKKYGLVATELMAADPQPAPGANVDVAPPAPFEIPGAAPPPTATPAPTTLNAEEAPGAYQAPPTAPAPVQTPEPATAMPDVPPAPVYRPDSQGSFPGMTVDKRGNVIDSRRVFRPLHKVRTAELPPAVPKKAAAFERLMGELETRAGRLQDEDLALLERLRDKAPVLQQSRTPGDLQVINAHLYRTLMRGAADPEDRAEVSRILDAYDRAGQSETEQLRTKDGPIPYTSEQRQALKGMRFPATEAQRKAETARQQDLATDGMPLSPEESEAAFARLGVPANARKSYQGRSAPANNLAMVRGIQGDMFPDEARQGVLRDTPREFRAHRDSDAVRDARAAGERSTERDQRLAREQAVRERAQATREKTQSVAQDQRRLEAMMEPDPNIQRASVQFKPNAAMDLQARLDDIDAEFDENAESLREYEAKLSAALRGGARAGRTNLSDGMLPAIIDRLYKEQTRLAQERQNVKKTLDGLEAKQQRDTDTRLNANNRSAVALRNIEKKMQTAQAALQNATDPAQRAELQKRIQHLENRREYEEGMTRKRDAKLAAMRGTKITPIPSRADREAVARIEQKSRLAEHIERLKDARAVDLDQEHPRVKKIAEQQTSQRVRAPLVRDAVTAPRQLRSGENDAVKDAGSTRARITERDKTSRPLPARVVEAERQARATEQDARSEAAVRDTVSSAQALDDALGASLDLEGLYDLQAELEAAQHEWFKKQAQAQAAQGKKGKGKSIGVTHIVVDAEDSDTTKGARNGEDGTPATSAEVTTKPSQEARKDKATSGGAEVSLDSTQSDAKRLADHAQDRLLGKTIKQTEEAIDLLSTGVSALRAKKKRPEVALERIQSTSYSALRDTLQQTPIDGDVSIAKAVDSAVAQLKRAEEMVSNAVESNELDAAADFLQSLIAHMQQIKSTAQYLNQGSAFRAAQYTTSMRRVTPLNDTVRAALADGNLQGALDALAEGGGQSFVRDAAARLKGLLGDTRVELVDRVDADDAAPGFKAEGMYNPRENKIQLDRAMLSEETLLHEAVHAATLRALADPNALTANQRKAARELKALFESVQNDAEFSKQYGTKDLKEFLSELLSNSEFRDLVDTRMKDNKGFLRRIADAVMDLLGIKHPSDVERASGLVYKLFQPSTRIQTEQNVASIMRGVFPKHEGQFDASVAADAVQAVRSLVRPDAGFVDKVSAVANGMYWRTKLFDRFAGYEELVKQGVDKGTVTAHRLMQSMMLMRRNDAVTHMVSAAAVHGAPTFQRRADGYFTVDIEKDRTSLKDISEALGKAAVGDPQATTDLFTSWMAVQRADTVGLQKLGISQAQANAILNAVASNKQTAAAFENARKMYKDYNTNLLNFLVQAGAMDKQTAADLLVGDYIPYYRERADGVIHMVMGNSKPFVIGNTVDQPHLKELIGGDQRILPFFDGAMRNTSLLMNIALRNIQTKEAAYMMQDLGLGTIMSSSPPAGMNIMKFSQNGERYWVNLDRSKFPAHLPMDTIVMGLQGIKTAVPALVKTAAIPANFLRKAVTRMPLYAMRQMIRDPLHAALTTGANFNPVMGSFGRLADVMKDTDATAAALRRAGVVSTNVATGDFQDIARTLRDIEQGKTPFHQAMYWLDSLAMAADATTRATLYDSFRKQGLTDSEAKFAAMESMNFSRRGTSSSLFLLSNMIPFMNAQVQGLDAVYRAMTGKTTFEQRMDVRNKLYQRGALLAAGTVAYALGMEDDETYQNATPAERAANWFVHVPGIDETVRIPIPFELGLVFKTIPELFINTAFGDTKAKDAAKALAQQAWASNPVGIPTAAKPLLEVVVNKSFFSNQPIESSREQSLQTVDRYRANTTELAKLLGQNGVVSPLQIEHLARGYLGPLGITLMSVADLALRPLTGADAVAKPDMRASDIPFFGPLFQPDDGRGIINAAYESMADFQRAHQTYKAMLERGDRAEAAEFASKYSREIALARAGGQYRQQMGELAKLKRNIAMDKTMDGAQKRARIDEIRAYEIKLAKVLRSYEAVD